MKPWHVIGPVYGCLAAAMLLSGVSGVACSASSSGIGGASDSGSGGETSSSASFGPAHDGTGMACTPQTDQTVASKITLKVNWPQTLANAGCVAPKCSGDIVFWLLAQYHIDSTNKVTGTTKTCANTTPPVPLTALGSQSEGLTSGQATVQILIGQDVWKAIAMNAPPAMTTGTLGGWKVGATMEIDPTTTAYGLKPSSTFANPATKWPCFQMSNGIPMSDFADDDNDGNPGITATASSASGFSLPATALTTSPPYAPKADKLYVALRTELRLYGTSSSCTDGSGTAEALLQNNHVIGCHIAPGETCTDSTCNCTADQSNFIDGNTTVYIGDGVTIPTAQQSCTAGFAPPGMMGTYQSKILSNDPDGGGIDCAAVIAALP
jgi:hypothetical protein